MQTKKIIAILVIFVCVGTALSAQDIGMSFGGGAFLDWGLFGNGTKFTHGKDSGRPEKDTDSFILQNMSFGGYAFFDITYAEIDVSFAYGMLTGFSQENKESKKEDTSGDMSVLQLGFTLLGKYPINLGQITVFPLAGIHYNMVLSSDPKVYPYDGYEYDKDGEIVMEGNKPVTVERKISELNQFSILVGGGLDYNINKNLYLRFSLLGQLRFASKAMSDSVSVENNRNSADERRDGNKDYGSTKTTVGFGPVIKVGVGYRF